MHFAVILVKHFCAIHAVYIHTYCNAIICWHLSVFLLRRYLAVFPFFKIPLVIILPAFAIMEINKGSQAPGIRDKQFAPVVKSVYRPHRTPSRKIHPYILNVEKQILNGQGVARALLDLRKKGFKPDREVRSEKETG